MRTVMCVVAAIVALQPVSVSKTRLDAFLRARVDAGDAPAVVAMVVDAHATLYTGAAGKARPDSVFRIASMAKPITSVAAMMLYEEGKLGLDDPVTKYLPEVGRLRVVTAWHEAEGTYDSRPPKRPITIRDLLTQTSGMAYSFEDARLAKLDDNSRSEFDLPLLHDPGEKFTYGPNTMVLGRVVEKISGQSLDLFFKRRIFDPLGMTDTSYVVPPDKRERVVTVSTRGGDGSWKETPNPAVLRSRPRGDGGLFSTAADYCRFMQLFLNHGRSGNAQLLRPSTIAIMTSSQIGKLVIETQPSVNTAILLPFPIGAGKDKFGFGFQIETAPATPGMRSAGSLSWGGVQNTHFWIDPPRGIAVVVLMQVLPYYDPHALDVLRGFERLVYGGVPLPTPI